MDLPERDQRYLEKKYAHLLGNGTEKYDRAAQDKEAEKELEERPIHWRLVLLFAPLYFFEYLGKLDRKANGEVIDSILFINLLNFVRVVLGISGCVLSLWALWPIFIELIYTSMVHVNRVLTTLTMLMMLLCCVGCIFVFLYSFFDGKKERYFRLVAQIILVIIFFGFGILFEYLDTIERFGVGFGVDVDVGERIVLFKLGIYVAFLCLFPRTHRRVFLASIILSPVFFYILLLILS